MNRAREILYALLPLSVALALRLYPTLTSSLPFSTDAWPPIRNTELLLKKTPTDIGDKKIFDGYNNYWPANSLFGATLAEITGLKPIVAMATGIPAAASLTTLIFYALAKKIGGNPTTALTASTLLATAFPYTLLTAGVTKETYANPLYILTILIFLTQKGWKTIPLFTITTATLVMAHHLTSAITLAVIASITLSQLIESLLTNRNPNKLQPTLTSIMALSITLYFILYAHRGFKITLTPSDLISAASHQTIAFTLTLYLTQNPKPSSTKHTAIKCILASAAATLILTLCTIKPITPEAPILPNNYIIYGLPFITAFPLAIIGYEQTKKPENKNQLKFTPLLWLASILGAEAYAAFGNPPAGLALAYRTLNFLWPPLTLLYGQGIQKLYSAGKNPKTKLLAKTTAILALTLTIGSSCYNLHASIHLQERYLGYFWLYKIQEYKAAEWTKNLIANQTVSCDVKIHYLLKGYFNLKTNELQALKYLWGKDSHTPQILFTYNQMQKNGYVIYGGYSVNLPENWTEKIQNLNHIYSNNLADIYSAKD